MKVPMYYYTPASIEDVDVEGKTAPDRWDDQEVNLAKTAFGPSKLGRFFRDLGF
jgi:hypothetical protein